MKSTEEAIFQQKKPQNQFIRGQITFGIQLQTFPSKCNTRKLQFKTGNTAEKPISNNGGNYTHQYKEVEEKLKPVSFISFWTLFEHQVKYMYASQKNKVSF